MRYEQILSRIYNRPHLVMPEKLETIRRYVTARALGVAHDISGWEAAVNVARQRSTQPPIHGTISVQSGMWEMAIASAREQRAANVTKSVAVLPIVGTLSKRADIMDEASGGTSTDRLGRDFDRLMADESISAIVLDVDSPGGESFGVQELSDKIYAARGRKPVIAVANPEAASAAYYIASAADSISITPSGWVGSVGVVAVHTDLSKLNETMGVTVSYIYAGDYKVEGNPDAPLSEEARAYYQEQVDGIYKQFIDDLARNRNTIASDIRANYGSGRMLRAQAARQVGMADAIETLDEAISRVAEQSQKRSGRLALERKRLDLLRSRS